MARKNFVSNDFLSTFVDSSNVFDCRLPGVNRSESVDSSKGMMVHGH